MFKKTRILIKDVTLAFTFIYALYGLVQFVGALGKEGLYQIRRRKNPDLLPPL